MTLTSKLTVATSKPAPLGMLVLDQVRDLILDGKVGPGDLLPETELAALFEVSRGPIREALRALEAEGLVVSAPRRRARVATLTLADAEEIYSLRRSLEILAARRAVEHATEEHITEMRAILTRMDQELTDGDAVQLSRLDTAFHDVMYRAARHSRLYHAWSELRSQVTFFLISRNTAVTHRKQVAIAEHHALADALEARDAELLVHLTEEHLLTAYERLSEAMQPEDEAMQPEDSGPAAE